MPGAMPGLLGGAGLLSAEPEWARALRLEVREQEEQEEQDDSYSLTPVQVIELNEAIAAVSPEKLTESIERHYSDEMRAFVEQAAKATGITVDFEVLNPLIEAHAKAVATEHMQEVTETTRGYLRDALAAGIREGEDTRTIRKRLLEVPGFDGGDARAVMVARTEVTRSSNYGQVESWKASDGAVTEKRWIATADSTTRESHRELNGQVQKLDQPFHVNGHAGMYPGDFGEAAEDINCRCTVGAVISDPDLSDFDALEDAANWSFTRGAEPSEEQLARAWRAYVKAVAPWEKTTAADVRRGFEGQRDDFERAIGGVLGRKTPVNTPRRGGSRS